MTRASPLSREDAERVVAGLTKAQRAMLVHAAPFVSDRLRCWGNENTKKALAARGLAQGAGLSVYFITERGLAVRALLLERNR